jgi:NAD-dependent deacetylase
MKKIVIFSGAGLDAESGVATFRTGNGLWDNYNIEDVASIDGWYKDKSKVLEFYNKRRAELKTVSPNLAHYTISEMEKDFDITVVTQNVTNLQERSGSSNVIHLHGELTKSRSTVNPNLIYDIDGDINIGDKCEKGSQLRPHIIWFGEGLDPDIIKLSVKAAKEASVIIIVGTSLNVQPAASIFLNEDNDALIYYVDPCELNKNLIPKQLRPFFIHIKENATTGVIKVYDELLELFK